MKKLSWIKAIEKVLEEEKRALHYTEIAQLIFERQYREPGSGGAAPANIVYSELYYNIKNNKKSAFTKVEPAKFILRKFLDDNFQLLTDEKTDSETGRISAKKRTTIEEYKIINAFGIYWNKNLVHWKTSPDLFGIQLIGASEVNFKDQIGIYLLHDNRETIYVGQAIDQPLGQRLKNHTTDRLSGRWDRFSWFGFYAVSENGQLDYNKKYENIGVQNLADTLEAILIESIEPRQNRKQGNLFYGIEYLQQEAPEIKKKMKEQLLLELAGKLQ